MKNTKKYYRFGEPTIGQVHSAFRNKKALTNFLSSVGEKNLVDLFEIRGKVIEDKGGPDGLYILVRSYKKIEFDD